MEAVTMLKEPLFWVLTAIGSIILSIIANLLTPRFQKFLSTHSSAKKEKIEAEKRELLSIIIKLHESQSFRVSWQVDAVIAALKGVGIILLFLAFSRVMAMFPFYELRLIVYPILAVGTVYGYRKIHLAVNDAAMTKFADEREAYIAKKELKKEAN